MNWRTLIYQIPREPQKNRIAVWRRLKYIGAQNIFQSIWILPDTEETEEEFKRLEEQIIACGGQSISCITLIDDEDKNSRIIEQFNKEREADYHELIEKCDDFEAEIDKEIKRENFTFAEIEENEHEIKKLNIWLKKIERKDYFGCPLKIEIIKRIDKCSSLLNEFSNKVFEMDDNSR